MTRWQWATKILWRSALLVPALWLGALSAPGCGTDLTGSVEGKLCGAHGECLPGYVCDTSNNTCVHPDAISQTGADASTEALAR